ncbi:MAG TPA: hypothetical protein IGS37_00385 [Synechococcales cyanobacterium M55_K2018_004]|nr:hypothetical protein [Synechococcales cyanobacterium M55_K2018_004]
MPIVNIDITRFDNLIINWFRECTPKILVVTDNLNYSPTNDFGLTEFVNTLRSSTIHGMTPIVITANFSPSGTLSYNAATQHITNFKFTDPTHGLLKSRYDVVLMLAIHRETGPKLTDEAGALNAVINFMQAGGGVFATGDHEDLGAGMCMDIPRVRAMRNWRRTDTPSAGGSDRLTTNLAGSDDVYQFEDQSDEFPQRLYVNYRTNAGGIGNAHPLLQVPGSSPARAIEVFPDHPHEGECRVPSNLTTKMPDGVSDEWPMRIGIGGAATRVAPEAVALTMSHGNAFSGKAAVSPRSFISICAYDGHLANVGRVVTDATWHHFVNVNLVGVLPTRPPGRQGLTGRNLDDVKQYYKNLVTWLMPRSVRRCLRYPWLLQELVRFPLFEELRPAPFDQLKSAELREIGALVETALTKREPQFQVQQLTQDMLEDVLGADAVIKLSEFGREFGKITAREAGLAALGAMTMAIANTATEMREREKIEGATVFGPVAEKAIALGIRRYLEESRAELQRMDALIESITL